MPIVGDSKGVSFVQAVRRIALLLMCLAFAGGCALFNRGSEGNNRFPFFGTAANQPAKAPKKPADPLVDSDIEEAKPYRGVLAGRVVDAHSGQPLPAYIRYVCLDEANAQAAPVDVRVDEKGYFTIYGVKPGKHYKLVAFAEHRGKKVAGVKYAVAPEVRLVIPLSADRVTPDTPAPPRTPSYDDPKPSPTPPRQDPLFGNNEKPKTESPGDPYAPPQNPYAPKQEKNDDPYTPSDPYSENQGEKKESSDPYSHDPYEKKNEGYDPYSGGERSDPYGQPKKKTDSGRGFGIGDPQPLDEEPGSPSGMRQPANDQWGRSPQAPQPEYPRNIASGDPVRPHDVPLRTRPFQVDQPRPLDSSPRPKDRPKVLPPPPKSESRPSEPLARPVPPRTPRANIGTFPSTTRVPSCVVVGGRIINFALRDFYGKTWEWKRHRRGRLVLIDFWKTNCVFCLQDMGELRRLQTQYGKYGLEILGIASEDFGSEVEQRKRVVAVCNRYQTQHRMLINAGASQRDVLRKFGVHAFPTLVLYDDQGREIWRHVGKLNPVDIDMLDRLIRARLQVQ